MRKSGRIPARIVILVMLVVLLGLLLLGGMIILRARQPKVEGPTLILGEWRTGTQPPYLAEGLAAERGTSAALTIPIHNLGREEVITSITTSCGCTSIDEAGEPGTLPLREGELLPSNGRYFLRFNVNTEGEDDPILGEITVKLADGREATTEYRVRVLPGTEFQDGAGVARLLQAAPGQTAETRFWLRFPDPAWSVASTNTYDPSVSSSFEKGSTEEQPGTWWITLKWTPPSDKRNLETYVAIVPDRDQMFARDAHLQAKPPDRPRADPQYPKVYILPVRAQSTNVMSVEPASWVLGSVKQPGEVEMSFTLKAADGRPLHITRAHSDIEGFAVFAMPSGEQKLIARVSPSELTVPAGGGPLVTYLLVETDHPQAPLVKIPVVAVE